MPSKSARKREMLSLQALGERLIELDDADLGRLPLDEPLTAAIAHARRIRSRSAGRRQRQLIGKLMRSADADAIRRSLEAMTLPRRRATEAFHACESWRDRLATDGRSALDAFVDLTGREQPQVAALVAELHRASCESERRSVSRRLFRAVREALADAAEKQAAATEDGQ